MPVSSQRIASVTFDFQRLQASGSLPLNEKREKSIQNRSLTCETDVNIWYVMLRQASLKLSEEDHAWSGEAGVAARALLLEQAGSLDSSAPVKLDL